ncbi:MAG: dihydrolipoamide acetyltransferase family protein [Saprospiraceae bacterium]
MSVVEVLMPKMGESITDATIIKWYKKQGEKIIDEETLLEVATDKVDSEIPSPASGIVKKLLYNEDDVVNVGEVIALIEIEGTSESKPKLQKPFETRKVKITTSESKVKIAEPMSRVTATPINVTSGEEKEASVSAQIPASKFYSPLVKNIAAKEGISMDELDNITGSGANGRVTKKDILNYASSIVPNANNQISSSPISISETLTPSGDKAAAEDPAEEEMRASQSKHSGDEIIVMDRMRKLIADHMIQSKRTSAHVTSFAEADVTRMSEWRNKVKGDFLLKYGARLTFTPIMIEIVAKALREHPKLNASVNGNQIIIKRDINIGMATALPSGNLIVPVIHHADQYNLNGLAAKVSEKVEKARNNKLGIAEIQNGTFTITNIGSYGSQLGTPIINQPQVAILATGAIKKKPVVVESSSGDAIGIRQMMYLSMSYDHRVIDGYLGGTFLQTVVRLLENFDDKREI